MPSQLQLVTDKFYSDLDASEAKAFKALARAHQVAIDSLGADLAAVQAIMEKDAARGLSSGAYALQQQRLAALTGQASRYFSEFGTQAGLVLTKAQQEVVDLASQTTVGFIVAQNGPIPSAIASLAVLPEPAIQQIVGTLGDGSPLRTLSESFGSEASRVLNRTLVQAVAVGLDPLATGRRLAEQIPDLSISRARTILRTEMMRAFREGSRRVMLENQDVVKGWQWHSFLDQNTCPVCWAMHGKQFKLSVAMATHPNCRCFQMPVTYTWKELGFTNAPEPPLDPTVTKPGSHFFRGLPEAQQRKVLGQAGYTAWKNKVVTLDDFVQDTYSDAWGWGRTTRSMKSLVGPENVQKLSKGIVPQGVIPKPGITRIDAPGDPFRLQRNRLDDALSAKQITQAEYDQILANLSAGSFPDPGDMDNAITAFVEKPRADALQAIQEAEDIGAITAAEAATYRQSVAALERADLEDLTSTLTQQVGQKKAAIQQKYDETAKLLIDELDKSVLFGNTPQAIRDDLVKKIKQGDVFAQDSLDNLLAFHIKDNLDNNPFLDLENAINLAESVGGLQPSTAATLKATVNSITIDEAKKLTKLMEETYEKFKPINSLHHPGVNYSKLDNLLNQGKLKASEYQQIIADINAGKYNVIDLNDYIDNLEVSLANKVTKSSQQLLDELDQTNFDSATKLQYYNQYKAKQISKEDLQALIDQGNALPPPPPPAPPAPLAPAVPPPPVQSLSQLHQFPDQSTADSWLEALKKNGYLDENTYLDLTGKYFEIGSNVGGIPYKLTDWQQEIWEATGWPGIPPQAKHKFLTMDDVAAALNAAENNGMPAALKTGIYKNMNKLGKQPGYNIHSWLDEVDTLIKTYNKAGHKFPDYVQAEDFLNAMLKEGQLDLFDHTSLINKINDIGDTINGSVYDDVAWMDEVWNTLKITNQNPALDYPFENLQQVVASIYNARAGGYIDDVLANDLLNQIGNIGTSFNQIKPSAWFQNVYDTLDKAGAKLPPRKQFTPELKSINDIDIYALEAKKKGWITNQQYTAIMDAGSNPYGKLLDEVIEDVQKILNPKYQKAGAQVISSAPTPSGTVPLSKPSSVAGKKTPYKKHVDKMDKMVQSGKIDGETYDYIIDQYNSGKWKNKHVEDYLNQVDQSPYVYRQGKPDPASSPGVGGGGNLTSKGPLAGMDFQQIVSSQGNFRDWETNFDARGFMRTRGKMWVNSLRNRLTRDDITAISDYTGTYYSSLNNWLRRDRMSTSSRYYSPRDSVRIRDGLDRSLDTPGGTPEDIVVTRNSKVRWNDPMQQLQPGDVFEDAGYMSSSLEPNWGSFESSTSPGATLSYKLIVKVPKGSRGMYINPFSNFASEEEFLFPRNSRLLVVNVEDNVLTDNGNRLRVFHAILLE